MPVSREEVRFLAVLGLIVGAFGVGLWLPAHRERAKLQTRIDQARQQLEAQRANADEVARLHQQVVQLSQAVSRQPHQVPEQEDLDQVLRHLTRALQSSNVREPDLTTRDTRHFAHYSIIPIEVEFQGSFRDAFGVLERIESMPRLIRVDRLELEGQERNTAGPLSVSLQLSAFVAREEASKP